MGLKKNGWQKTRTVSFMQYLHNPETGDELLNLKKLRASLQQLSGIKRWAYIVHEPDTSEAHVHGIATQIDDKIPLRKSNPKTKSAWAKIFGVPEDKVWAVTDGEAGIADALGYMLHLPHFCDSDKANEPYSQDAMEAKPGWNWWPQVQDRQTNKATTGSPAFSASKKKDVKRSVRGQIMDGMSLKEALKISNVDSYKLIRWRREYLHTLTPPPVRVNFFVDVSGVPDLERKPIIRELAAMIAGKAGAFRLPIYVNHRRVEPLARPWQPRSGLFHPYDRTIDRDELEEEEQEPTKYVREVGSNWDDYDGESVLLIDNLCSSNDLSDETSAVDMSALAEAFQPRYVGYSQAVHALFRALNEAPAEYDSVDVKASEFRYGNDEYSNQIRLAHRSTIFVSSSLFDEVRGDLEDLYRKHVLDSDIESADSACLHMPVFVSIDATTVAVQPLDRFVNAQSHNHQQYVGFNSIRNNLTQVFDAQKRAASSDPAMGKRVLQQGISRQFSGVSQAENTVSDALNPPLPEVEDYFDSLDWEAP